MVWWRLHDAAKAAKENKDEARAAYVGLIRPLVRRLQQTLRFVD